jgi:hypothetical protein
MGSKERRNSEREINGRTADPSPLKRIRDDSENKGKPKILERGAARCARIFGLGAVM